MSGKLSALKKIWAFYGKFYGLTLDEAQVRLYAEATHDLEFARVQEAMSDFMKSERRMMLPADIREKIYPKLSNQEDSQIIARKIMSSLYRHSVNWLTGIYSENGNYWDAWNGEEKIFPSRREAILFELGESGLEVIEKFGGYSRILDAWRNSQDTQFFAQLRDLCAAVTKQNKNYKALENKNSDLLLENNHDMETS